MGNCLVLQENIVRIMKSDGKILEYKTPIKVHQVLSQFSGHEYPIFHFQVLHQHQHLYLNTKLIKGKLYYYLVLLLPLTPPISLPKASKKKKVRFFEPEVEEAGEERKGDEVVRIKIVISKQQLHDRMTQKGGDSANELLSPAGSENEVVDEEDHISGSEKVTIVLKGGNKAWNPYSK